MSTEPFGVGMQTVFDDEVQAAVHFNSDGSGDVKVWHDGREVAVPFRLLVAAVAHVVRAERIGALEQASDEEIVGLQ